MDKLGEFANQAERFLRSLSRDLNLPVKKGEWLASDFRNESVSFDGEYAGAVPDFVVNRGAMAVEFLVSANPIAAVERGYVEVTTAAEFAQLGKALDPDEHFVVGVYRNGGAPEWHDVTYKQTAELRALLQVPVVSYGSVQGVIHAWFSGASPAFFQIRDLANGELIHCTYDAASLHEKILKAHERENSVIHVYGNIRWDRTKDHIVEIKAEDIELAQPLSGADFERLFGSMPDFTGDMSTSEYLEWIRGNGGD